MTENNNGMQAATQEDELVLVLDGIYSELAQDINAAKSAIVSEVKYSAVQSQAVEKDLTAKLNEQLAAIKALANELKYSLQQNQAVHNDISDTIKEEVSTKLDTVADNTALLQEIDKAIHELEEKIAAIDADAVADKVLAGMPVPEEVDYDKINEGVAEKAEAVVSEHSKQVLDAVAAIPVAENVDYTRIVEEVGDKVLELLQDQQAPAIDYDKIVFETAEKVVESLPPVEKIDYDKLAELVASKMAAPEIDYELLAEKVAEKVSANIVVPVVNAPATEETNEVFIDEDGVQQIADAVANKLADSLTVDVDYDRVCQAAQAAQVVTDPIDYDRIADVVIERFSAETFTFEEIVEEPVVEETVVEEPVYEEPVYEEPVVEEPVYEEPVYEAPIYEAPIYEAPVEEAPVVVEELAVAEAPAVVVAPRVALVEAGGDLVVRLKRSFVAKLKQSEEDIKSYYSVLKNALTEYSRINSNISWHGDRFNFGRDTVARITIIGKTLGLYLALDPADPEFKQTVYRQKDVSKQKAYDGTPFMVKIKSDGGLKKALRLVAALAEKLGAEKDAAFEAVDYVAMYPVATDEEMLEEGLIKATKEKKVELDF